MTFSREGNIFFRCVEDSNEAIMISDEKGVLVYVNPAWCRIYGYSKEEAVGRTPRLLHSGMQSDEFYREMWDSIRDPSRGYWKGELVNRGKNGNLVPVLLSITPFKAEGALSGYMGIAVDITEKRELAAKVAHQDRLASIGLLASGLAHEVGTPLGVVRGRAEFQHMRAGNDPALRKDLEIIISQIDRVSKLIRSLLRVSRSFTDVHLENVRIQSVVDDVLALVGQNLRENHVEIRVDVAEGLEARADTARLEQVLLNLVMNSIHAIRVSIAQAQPGAHRLELRADVEGGKILLRVIDTGCGISPENMKKLFRPFFTTKDVGEGTGLGLAIVSQLVSEMHGSITATSELGRGTTFWVWLEAAMVSKN